MSYSHETYKERLKSVRDYFGYDYETMAEILDCPTSSYFAIENVSSDRTLSGLYMICKKLHVSPAYLIGISDDMFERHPDPVYIKPDRFDGLTPNQIELLINTIKTMRKQNSRDAKALQDA